LQQRRSLKQDISSPYKDREQALRRLSYSKMTFLGLIKPGISRAQRLVLKVCLMGIGIVCTGFGAHAGACTAASELYLTFDTGHMGVAPWVAEVLKRHNVQATFFLANEPTLTNGSSLDEHWAPWWKQLAAQGHAFGSHTFDHVYWVADAARSGVVTHVDLRNCATPSACVARRSLQSNTERIGKDCNTAMHVEGKCKPQIYLGHDTGFKVKASAGPNTGLVQSWSAKQYCEELKRPAARFEAMTGHHMARLFRAPGGRTSPALLAAAKRCGFAHVPWNPAGFLGDELPSQRYPNALLLQKALRDIQAGNILLAHLGIWSRQDPWAPAVLEPLIVGLKNKGFCFATLREHPVYRQAFD
jgi:peptidoglycan-N-acetylmuramic acid deacetylase